MDLTGMIAELRLELDRIERSILILDTLACPRRATPPKHRRGPPARFAGRSTADAHSRTGKVVSIVRGASAPQGHAGPFDQPPQKDQSESLRELRIEMAKFQKALAALVQQPGD